MVSIWCLGGPYVGHKGPLYEAQLELGESEKGSCACEKARERARERGREVYRESKGGPGA